jgi:Tfp pilus assembly protein PilF
MKQVVDMQPSDPEAREFFAQILDAQGDRAAAAQQHQRALQLRTGNQDQGDKGQSR